MYVTIENVGDYTRARGVRERKRRLLRRASLHILVSAAIAAAPPLAYADESAAASANQGAVSQLKSWSALFASVRPVEQAVTRKVVIRFDRPSLSDWQVTEGNSLSPAEKRQFIKKAYKEQNEILESIRSAGVGLDIEYRYLRVVNGVAVTVRDDLSHRIESVPGVASVEHVRTLYPAGIEVGGERIRVDTPESEPTNASDEEKTVDDEQVDDGDDFGRPSVRRTLSGKATVAVLDTGIDMNHPVLAPRIASAGYDVFTKRTGVDPQPGDAHGTHVAGAVLIGASGDAGIVPVRIIGRTPVEGGIEADIGSTATLIAGLEYAVDPDGDAGTDDAIPVAVVAATAPYAGFSKTADSFATRGADRLGTLVVAASGNDGHGSSDTVGTLGAPASSPTVLAVGAADLRETVDRADIHVRSGVVDAGIQSRPMLTRNTSLPPDDQQLVVVEGKADQVADYLGADITSRVAGKVALIEHSFEVPVARQITAATDAGATAVLIGGSDSQALAGVVDQRGADIAAVGISLAEAARLKELAAINSSVKISMVARNGSRNPSWGKVAAFSSAGPRFDGHSGVDLIASGVGVITTAPGAAQGEARYEAASGTSIAAGHVAGVAAVIRSSEPDWSPVVVQAAMVGTAQPLDDKGDKQARNLQGGGVASAAKAARATTVALPFRVDFGIVEQGEKATVDLELVGTKSLTPLSGRNIAVESDSSDAPALSLSDDGGVTVSTAANQKSGVYGGWLIDNSSGIRIPWQVTVRRSAEVKVPVRASLDESGDELVIEVGGAHSGDGSSAIRALSRSEVHLIDVKTESDLGVLARTVNMLPGVYRYSLDGRDPSGMPLQKGRNYLLRVFVTTAHDPKAEPARLSDIKYSR